MHKPPPDSQFTQRACCRSLNPFVRGWPPPLGCERLHVSAFLSIVPPPMADRANCSASVAIRSQQFQRIGVVHKRFWHQLSRYLRRFARYTFGQRMCINPSTLPHALSARNAPSDAVEAFFDGFCSAVGAFRRLSSQQNDEGRGCGVSLARQADTLPYAARLSICSRSWYVILPIMVPTDSRLWFSKLLIMVLFT